MATNTLTAESIEVRLFLLAWHENGRESFARAYPSSYAIGAYDAPSGQLKAAVERKRWICLDEGISGRFVADRATGEVYTIKAYGRPNRKIGTLASLTAEYTKATAHSR